MILVAHSYYLRNDPKQLERMRPYPPLATLLAAALVRKNGYDIAFFDATFAESVSEFVATLNETRPAVVGILEDNFNFLTKMCTIRAREATLAMVTAAAERNCRVVVNGSDASDHPEMYLAAGADAVIAGEPEQTFLALAEAWTKDPDSLLSDIPGLVLADGPCDLKRTRRRPSIRDLDELPLPAWDLLDVTAYENAWREAHDQFSWNVVTSRGCPYGCNWCAKPIFGRRYGQRSPAAVAEELRLLKDTIHPDHVWFADDIFGLTAGWILDFMREVRIRHARIPFMMQSRANLMTPIVVRALAAAGAEEVWMGVESGSQRILNAMDKGTTVDEIRSATRALKLHGIRACWFIQLGYPSETWEDVGMTRDLIRDEQPDDIGVSVSYPLPGTKFYDSVRSSLGAQHNWEHTGELAMLFQSTYTTAFYRELRDALHAQSRTRTPQDALAMDAEWEKLSHNQARHRSPQPFVTPGV